MTNRRSLLLAAGAMLLASGAPALARQPITPEAYVAGVVARYVEAGPDVDFTRRYEVTEAGTRIGRLLEGSTVTRRKNETVVSVPESLLFDYPAASVRKTSVALLTEVARILHDRKGVSVEIMAHYHSDGRPSHAMVESGRRAVAIQGVLLSRGLEDGRVVASGLGEAWPLAGNDTVEGREENRRIDFVIRSH